MSELLAYLGSQGVQLLQQRGDQPAEETLCFSIVPLALVLGLFVLRARRARRRPAEGQ